MHIISSSRRMLASVAAAVALLLLYTFAAQAQSAGAKTVNGTAEQRTARYFESIRTSPPQMLAFFLKFPKGGDLHSHLSGAVYAESYIQWAANDGLCVNTAAMTLSPPPCDSEKGPPASEALSNPVLYRQLVDA